MSGLSKMVGAVWYCEGLDLPDAGYNVTYHDSKALTDLKGRDGNSLGIEATDTFTVIRRKIDGLLTVETLLNRPLA